MIITTKREAVSYAKRQSAFIHGTYSVYAFQAGRSQSSRWYDCVNGVDQVPNTDRTCIARFINGKPA